MQIIKLEIMWAIYSYYLILQNHLQMSIWLVNEECNFYVFIITSLYYIIFQPVNNISHFLVMYPITKFLLKISIVFCCIIDRLLCYIFSFCQMFPGMESNVHVICENIIRTLLHFKKVD